MHFVGLGYMDGWMGLGSNQITMETSETWTKKTTIILIQHTTSKIAYKRTKGNLVLILDANMMQACIHDAVQFGDGRMNKAILGVGFAT